MDMATQRERMVVIRLRPQLAALAEAAGGAGALADRLAPVVADLLDDLAIPVTYALAIVTGAVDGPDIAIAIEDRSCRVADAANHGPVVDLEDLTHRLAAALHDNRTLFLPPDVAVACWQRWSGAADSPPADFPELLRRLIERGVRIDRLCPLIGEITAADDTSERTLANADGPRVRMFVSQEQFARLYDPQGQPLPLAGEHASIDALLTLMSDGLFYELGLVYHLGGVAVDQTLAPGQLRFRINDLRTPVLPGLRSDELMVNDTVAALHSLGLDGRATINPANNNPTAVVAGGEEARRRCEADGLTVWDDHGYAILLLSSVIRREAGSLLTFPIARFLCDRLQLVFPDLVASARARHGEPVLTRVLRALLDEEIAIRDLRTILDCLASYHGAVPVDMSREIVFFASPGTASPIEMGMPAERDPVVDLIECVRVSLRRYISHKYTRGAATLVVHLVDPDLEQRLGDPAPLTADERARLLAAVAAEMPETLAAPLPVILTTAGLRARLRREIHREYPRLAVLSYQELSPDMNIQPLSRITWR